MTALTIAAIATPAGHGGVGIVRLSGPEAESILTRLVPGWPDEHPSHHLRLSRIVDDGELLDEALAVLMRGPKSYTGEDVVEFQCHGGPVILRKVLDAALAAGARSARPGEFTERAFLNGRLDLTQAEAVADLVNATSDAAHRLAMEHLEGSLGGAIRADLEAVTEAMVLLEAAIDFSHEEHVYQIERDEILARVDRVMENLAELRRTFDSGRRQREGVRVVIMGPTNAGKSSLFNALHGTERAIVTEVAGTTRDWLEEELVLSGVLVRLVDTAGLRDTSDRVEEIGIERSRALGHDADVVVWVVDRTAPVTTAERRELDALRASGRPVVVCINKADRPSTLSTEDQAWLGGFDHCYDTAFAAEERRFDDFLAALSTLAAELTSGEGVLLSRTRHLEAVIRADEALDRTRAAIEAEMEHELIAIDLREALDALGAIVGQVSTDDILNRIFGEFCVGK